MTTQFKDKILRLRAEEDEKRNADLSLAEKAALDVAKARMTWRVVLIQAACSNIVPLWVSVLTVPSQCVGQGLVATSLMLGAKGAGLTEEQFEESQKPRILTGNYHELMREIEEEGLEVELMGTQVEGGRRFIYQIMVKLPRLD